MLIMPPVLHHLRVEVRRLRTSVHKELTRQLYSNTIGYEGGEHEAEEGRGGEGRGGAVGLECAS